MEYQILLVDDEPHILKALVRLLRQDGIKALTAESGREALAIMSTSPVPVVISDFKMPNMSGTELLAKIEASWPQTVRIILSGHADFETVLQAVHSGVVHKFLAKPWNNQELIEHIRTSLAQVDHSRESKEKQTPAPRPSLSSVQDSSASQVQLQVVLDTVFDGIATINRQGIILSVNKAIERIFGYSQAELIGQNIYCLMPEPYRSQHNHYLSKFGQGDKGIIGNQRRLVGLRKNGEVFPIELGVNSMEIEGELQFLGMIRDISRRVSAESENKLLIDALEIAQDGFALFGPGDRLLHCNQQFRNLYHECDSAFDKGVLHEGVRYGDFFKHCIEKGLFVDAQSDPDQWLKRQSEAHQNLPIIQQYELRPGQWIEIHETRAENGSVIVSHLDISKLKQTQISLLKAVNEAEHANSARGRFLAMMSHEIRTPLNGVLGLLQLLQDTPLNPSQLDYVKTALTSGQSLLTIISDILDFTKIEADKLELMMGVCSLSQLTHELISLFKMRVEEKSIELNLSIDPNLPNLVELDGQRLRQVLLNLVGNGIKFTDTGSVELKLSLSADHQIQFEVIDTGIGIPSDEQGQVFSEFSTLSNNRDGRVYEGTGLGLAISQKLVVLMGGSITFESEINQGSRFCFRLPLQEVSNLSNRSQTETEALQLEGRVLLVDDSQTNRLVAKLMLESAGITVVCASDGFDALECYQPEMFDLILMDISMPGIDGLQTSEKLKQLETWDNIPILALTAYAMPEDKLRFEQHGLQGHIEKPLDKKELLRVLSLYLKTSAHNGPTSSELDKYLDAESAEDLGRKSGRELERELIEELEGESNESIAHEVPASVVINISCLDTLAADTSEEVLPQLVEIFKQDAKQRLDQLANSHKKDVIERHLHTLGSSAALYGLTACSDRARQLERCLIEGKDASAELPTFVRLCEQSLKALTQAVRAR